MDAIKNRIKSHVRVKASSLRPHPQNPRTHPDGQRSVLRLLLEEIGLARSVLAYEDAEWGLTLIDGHLRQEELGDQEVDVEVLDVTREEANKLLLAIDPLAALAGYDAKNLAYLRDAVEADSKAVSTLWKTIEAANKEAEESLGEARKRKKKQEEPPEAFKIIISCEDEKQQVALLRKLKREGLSCKALIS